MGAPDDLLYEYAMIRFVPRVDRGEFVNIGLIMMNKRRKWLKSRIMLDENRLKSLYPKFDLECLRNQSRLFELKDIPYSGIPVEEKYRWLTAVKSSCLQVSPSHPGLIIAKEKENIGDQNNSSVPEEMEREFNRLFNSLIL